MSILTAAQAQAVTGLSDSDPDWLNLVQPLLWPVAEQLCKDFVGYEVEQSTFTEWHPDKQLSVIRDELVDNAPFDLVGGRVVQYGLEGLNNQTIQLRRLPVRSITALYENPAAWQNGVPPQFPPDTLLQEGIDYQVDYREPSLSWTGMVFRVTGAWYMAPWAQRTIQVTYVAGVTPAELGSNYSRFAAAAIQAVQMWYRQTKAQMGDNVTGGSGGAIVSEALQGYNVSYNAEAALSNLGLESQLPRGSMKLLEMFQRASLWF